MEFLSQLWLPILLSGVFVFIASSVIHMVIPYHRNDYTKLKGEDSILDAMRAQGLGPGAYMFPRPDSVKDMQTPEMMEKYKTGPVGFMTVIDGMPFMGKSLVQWFVYTVVVGVFVGYLSWFALGATSEYLEVFRVAGTIAFVAYGVGAIPDSIWKGQPWPVTMKFLVDALIYSLVTAGAFGWLWPTA